MKTTIGTITLETVACECGADPIAKQNGVYTPYWIECPNCGQKTEKGYLVDVVKDWNEQREIL